MEKQRADVGENCYHIRWRSRKRPERIRNTFVHCAADPDSALNALAYIFAGRVGRVISIIRDPECGGKSYS